jgi:hypothetical protein
VSVRTSSPRMTNPKKVDAVFYPVQKSGAPAKQHLPSFSPAC